MPSHLPPHKPDQSKAPSLQRVILHAFQVLRTSRTPSRLRALSAFRPYMLGLCPTRLPGRVSPVPRCSVPTCRRRRPRGAPTSVPDQRCCLLPSPGHERLGSPKHLSADNLTRLLRSLFVAARWFAPLLFEGLSTLRSARSDFSSRLESAPGRSRAYPDRTFT